MGPKCGSRRTRTSGAEANDLQSFVIAATRYSQVRKGEDGRVDNSFYDWHYLMISTPRISNLHHQVAISHSPINLCTDARQRFPTTSFGDLRAANYTTPAYLRSESDSNRRIKLLQSFPLNHLGI